MGRSGSMHSMRLIVATLASVVLYIAAADVAPLKIDSPSGTVVGHYSTLSTGDEVRQFFGMRYAQPVIGDKRWKPALPGYTWAGELIANASGPGCPQLYDANEPVTMGRVDEDCLYVNVITPKFPKSDKLPVYMYIYGGSFTNGETSFYSEGGLGSNIPAANQDIVMVVFNYRLGPFGYLAMEELEDEDSAFKSSGNLGQQDQRAAMQWVQANIEAFGGDKHQVTIAGESAGAISIVGHVTSLQTTEGLFQGTYIESGTSSGGQFAEKADAQKNGAMFKQCAFTFLSSKYYTGPSLNTTDCSTESPAAEQLRCLRAVRWIDLLYLTKLVSANDTDVASTFKSCREGFKWTPVIDGYEWDHTPAEMAQKGQIAKNVTVLLGSVANEGSLFTLGLLLSKKLPSKLEVDALLAAVFSFLGHGIAPLKGLKAIELYHPSQYEDKYGNLSSWAALSDLGGDAMLFCPSRAFARALAAHDTPVYMYEYMRHPSCWTSTFPPISNNLDKLGVFHEADLPYTFNLTHVGGAITTKCNASAGNPYDPYQCLQCGPGRHIVSNVSCATEPAVAHNVFGYLTNMARHLNPNFDGATEWPLFNTNEDRIGINATAQLLQGPFASERCDFWDTVDVSALYKLLIKLGI